MPIIFGTPDTWKCDFLKFNPEEKCNKEEYVLPERTPKGWVENELGETFCSEHRIKDDDEE